MRLCRLPLFFITLTACSTTLAANQANNDQSKMPPPDLQAYIAQTPPKPSLLKTIVSRMYVSGKLSADFAQVSSIKTPTPQLQTVNDTAQKPNINDTALGKGISLGYAAPPLGEFLYSRFELEFMMHDGLKYNASPPFRGDEVSTTTLNSTIDTDTLMAKWYAEFQINTLPIRPFIVGGLGVANNITKSNATFNDTSTGNAAVTSNKRVSTKSFAWEVGAGANYYFNQHISLFADYEYINFGQVKWEMATNTTYNTAVLESKNYYANTINVGFSILF